MNIRLKQRLRSWTGAAVLAACAVGVAVVPSLRADDEKIQMPVPKFTTYIGELKDAPESARIAFVVEGDKFVAYICSGDQKFNDTFSRWLRGDVKDGQLSATGDGVGLTATLKDGTVSGTIKKDKAHEFTAKAIAGDADAGLFRASETFDEKDYTVGWIVDEKGNVVGTGGARGGPVQTLPGPKGNNNLQVVAAKKDGTAKSAPLQAGRVTGAGTGAAANNTGRKIDEAAKNEMLQDLVAERRANGGDAIHAMIIHQIRRFATGKKPESKLEEKIFAVLRTAPQGSLGEYVKLWDKLPKDARDALLGPAGAQLDANKALDSAQAARLAKGMAQLRTIRNGAPRAALAGAVKGVSIPTVKCIDETNPELIGKDEIFAIHTVIVGNGQPQIKRTGLLTGFDDGVTKSFSGADASVFPLSGQSPTEGAEIFVVSTLYEDDGSGVVAVLNFLKPIIQVGVILAVEALNGDQKTLSEFDKALIKLAVDAAIKGVSGPLTNLLVQPLGTDSIVVRPDGTIVSENGGGKTKMRFRKVKNGDVKFDYELSGFAVQK